MRYLNRARAKAFSGWLNGVAAGAVIACLSTAALAEAGDNNQGAASITGTSSVATVSATGAAIPIDEVNRYFLRMMTQIFDGAEDFSHTQVASFARMRKNNESLTLLDFGDGAVVISDSSGLSAGGFANVSGTELGLVYNYDTKSIGGTSPLARFHNEFVRPQLDRAPELGADANWATTIPATALGIAGLTGAGVEMDLSRQYFVYDGKPMVLVEYLIPAISYNTPGGTDVIHWGRGFALSDPGFGMIYANVALHRSTASEADGSLRPYRFYRASFASDDNGKPMIDIVKIPQVAKIYDDYFGKQALDVIPYSDVGLSVDQTPIKFAANLDIMAMAIGENGANDNSVLAAAQTGGNRGAEKAKLTPEQGAKKLPDGGLVYQGPRTREEMAKLGAKAYTMGAQPDAASGSSDPAVFPHESVFQSSGARSEPKVPDSAEARSREESAARAVERQVLKLAPPGSSGGGGGGGTEGGKSGKGSGGGGGNSANTLNTAVEVGEAVNLEVTAVDKTASVGGFAADRLVQKARELNAAAVAYQSKLSTASNGIKATSLEYALAVKERERLLNTTLDTEKIAEKTAEVAKLYSKLNGLQADLKTVTAESSSLGRKAAELLGLADGAPMPVFQKVLADFNSSPAAKVLGSVNIGLNVSNVVKAGQGTYSAATNDQSAGKLELNRKYVSTTGQALDNFESLRDLGLDILGLAIDLGSGNIKGAVSGGASLGSQSLSDLYIAIKGVADTNALNTKLTQEARVLQQRLAEMKAKGRTEDLTEIDAGLAEAKAELEKLKGSGGSAAPTKINVNDPRWDPVTGLPKKAEYWAWLKKNNRGALINAGINPDAPVGHTGPWPIKDDPAPANPRVVIKPKPVKTTVLDEPGYPTAPANPNGKPPPAAKPKPVVRTITAAEQVEIDRAARKAQAQTDLDAYQAKRRAERKAEEAAQSARPRGGPMTTSPLAISSLGTKPVKFNPVKIDPVTFDDDQDLFVRNEDGTTSLKKVGPDDFVLPETIPLTFKGPKSTEIEWTNFSDDDYPGGDSVPAFGYETMSGKIATDLAPWEEWLATQDIRKLERLARQAGYPNLASALTDAANLIRQSQDKGYRKWALTAPACGGLIGCGPSYLERWAAKQSIVGLGDILNTSRDVFSTGGLSDIAISGDVLAYMLRDFGLQDGDIVDVLIQQFGRTSFSGRVNLTNAGEAFRLNLRRGVAQLTLTAVNEGTASPNTAEINIQQVTRGDGRQTYSLKTGESATLRIENNRPAGN